MTGTEIGNTGSVTTMKMTCQIGGMGLRVGIEAPPLVVILPGAHDTMMTTVAEETIDLIGIGSVIESVDGIAMMIRIIAEIVIIDTAMTSTAVHGTHPIHLGMTVTVRIAALAAVDEMTEVRPQPIHGSCTMK